jgi:hypothetical protein
VGTKPTETRAIGDFLLIRELDHGGMGIVYEAEQISRGRRVALKILPGHCRCSEQSSSLALDYGAACRATK